MYPDGSTEVWRNISSREFLLMSKECLFLGSMWVYPNKGGHLSYSKRLSIRSPKVGVKTLVDTPAGFLGGDTKGA